MNLTTNGNVYTFCVNVSKKKKREKEAFVFTKTMEGKTLRLRSNDVMMRRRSKASRVSNSERRSRAAPQRLRSTLTLVRLRVNRNEQTAKLRSILQSSEKITEDDPTGKLHY
ncbi:hypothetical protein EVAR_56030_1 [Eumeta japonica]|uniref:Uncharacterized protein n=1 Tax=Eumeta variegata TaxID=151549 RepID=A0A4C1YJ54_EUMVA|nr:hypothetical protein EVAR_56030_1 [Eumeta japonica]